MGCAKFNLVLAVVFLVGLGVSAYVSYGCSCATRVTRSRAARGVMMETPSPFAVTPSVRSGRTWRCSS